MNALSLKSILAGKRFSSPVVYRSPNDKAGSPELDRFLNDLENLNMKIPMLFSLLVTSMLTLKTGGRRGILTMKVSQLKTYHQHLTLTKLYVN